MVIWGCIISMTTSQFDVNKLDKLKLYFGEPYAIHTPTEKDIIVYQPTIGDIVQHGEQEVYSVVNAFSANSTMYRLQLWDNGIDWNNVSDYEMFLMLVSTLSLDQTRLMFGDLDFQKFERCWKQMPDQEEPIITLWNAEQEVEIDEATHTHLCEYMRFLFNNYPKVEKAKGKETKKAIIWEERQKQKKNEDRNESILLPMISACLNHPGFKYKKNELREVGIVEFMDSVQRLQIYESTTALMRGAYSGFCDTSKIPKEQFNFMREIVYGRKPINPNGNKKDNVSIPEFSSTGIVGMSEKIKEKLNKVNS